jgi:hypothetical protein
MMHRMFAAAAAALLLAAHTAAAPDRLREDWLRKDLEGIATFLAYGPLEFYKADDLRRRLPEDFGWEEEGIGFDAKHVSIGRGLGYASVRVEAVVFRGDFALYELRLDSSSDEWKRLRHRYARAWAAAGGPTYVEDDSSFVARITLRPVLAAFESAVAAELGPMRPVVVPPSSQEDYDYFVSPLSNPSVSRGPIGPAGAEAGWLEWLERLVDEGKVDVVENVLRGHSPGGRVHAAIALLGARKRGLALSPEAEATIAKVTTLDVPVSTQAGCIVNGDQRADEVIDEFVNGPESEASEAPPADDGPDSADDDSGSDESVGPPRAGAAPAAVHCGAWQTGAGPRGGC